MSDTVITVENLSKRYRLGQIGATSLRDSVEHWWHKMRGRNPGDAMGVVGQVSNGLRTTDREGSSRTEVDQEDPNEILALKDVSFEVKRGEVLGIIGKNGAGKSTLLKILTRITEPTSGRAIMRGRVSSLLEVGTGFHPELTGRENTYLNGAILGMKKFEIDQKFDEIVAFSEIEKFIDTPVKRYSSGMYVRLAFAVAAHLEPDILLVDEVLAVGDMEFQKKCLGKMKEVSEVGRTVLFVSHNMAAINRLCQRAILLEHGYMSNDGASNQVVSRYLLQGRESVAIREWPDTSAAPGDDVVRLCSVRVRGEDGNTIDTADIRYPVGIEMEYEVQKEGMILFPNYHFFNELGICVFVVGDHFSAGANIPRLKGRYVSTAWIPGNFLAEGTLIVGVAVSTFNPVKAYFFETDAVSFCVVDSIDGDSARGSYAGPMPGVVRPILKWDTSYLPDDHFGDERSRA